MSAQDPRSGRATGLTALGKPTSLSPGVAGVTRIVCEGVELRELSHYEVVYSSDDPPGKPRAYATGGGKLWFRPLPDRVYRIDVEWDGHDAPDAPVLPLQPGWYAAYEAALAAAVVDRRAARV